MGRYMPSTMSASGWELGGDTGVIGESGSGKSTLTRFSPGLETPTSGTVRHSGCAPRLVPGRPGPAQVVFQDPAGSLNPYREFKKALPNHYGNGRAGQNGRRPGDARERGNRTFADSTTALAGSAEGSCSGSPSPAPLLRHPRSLYATNRPRLLTCQFRPKS